MTLKKERSMNSQTRNSEKYSEKFGKVQKHTYRQLTKLGKQCMNKNKNQFSQKQKPSNTKHTQRLNRRIQWQASKVDMIICKKDLRT